MLPEKITLTNAFRKYITETRVSAKEENSLLSADYVSKQIGRSKSWLSQVENGRLKTVKKNDLINVFSFILNQSLSFTENLLDDELMHENAIIEHGFINENGEVLNHSDLFIFDQIRGHLRFATHSLNKQTKHLLKLSTAEIKENIKKEISAITENVVYWINRAFTNVSQLYTDEISMLNLYIIIETSYRILEDQSQYYAFNPPEISYDDLRELHVKLNDPYVFIDPNPTKPINTYKSSEINEVIKNFSSEEYMMWENKRVYIGEDPLPMLVNFQTLKTLKRNDFHYYKDVTKLHGLEESEYLYIIKQIYIQFETIYQKCQSVMKDLDDLKEEYNILLEKNENSDKT